MNSCAVCHEEGKLSFCGRCQSVAYCSREHQQQDWKKHKKSCSKKTLAQEVESKLKIGPENGDIVKKNGNQNSDMNGILTDVGELSIRAENPQFMPQWVSQNSVDLNPFEVLTQRELSIVQRVCMNMQRYGICVIDDFLDEKSAELCIVDAKSLYGKPDSFKPGQVIRPGSTAKSIRGDKITWLDGSEDDAQNLSHLCRKMDSIVSKCNSNLGNYKIFRRTKAMLACYPGNGAAYQCHIDNPTGDGRCVTAIYYMNKGWDRKTMGGMLRIYPRAVSKLAEVEPKFNRFLLFFSDKRNPHEVMPAYAQRFAITLWYFDEEERSRALATWAKQLPRN